MTIEKCKIEILKDLTVCEYTCFKDFQKERFSTEDLEIQKGVFLLACEDLEKRGLIRKIPNNSETWVLVESFDSLPQDIRISGIVATNFANRINEIIQMLNLPEEGRVNSLNIRECDITTATSFLSLVKLGAQSAKNESQGE